MNIFRIKYSWISFFFFLPVLLMGQMDTIYFEKNIEITAPKIREQTIGSQSQLWDSETLNVLPANNIAELLNSESGVFIKNYGLGSLATSSIRGGSSGHTLVLWNGMPLQSPMLGLLDLSLLPIGTVEEIKLQKGGGSALWGSGAIGGVVSLNNVADFSNKIFLSSQTEVGSFGEFKQHIKTKFGNNKFQAVTKLFHHRADNDFNYQINSNLPERQQTNAHFSQQNIMQDFYWKINSQHRLSAHFWQQYSNREIPPATTQNRSSAHQNDQSTRMVLNWQQFSQHGMLQARLGFVNEHLDFFDDLILLESKTHFKILTGELSKQWAWNNHGLFIGTTHSYSKAYADAYGEPPSQNKSAIFASYKMEEERWKLQASLRQELVDGDLIPLVPDIGLDYKLTSVLNLKLKVSKNYRLPTFNNLYWVPGGNPQLKAESGWSQEGTVSANLKKENSLINISITGFNRNIDNWMLWSRNDGEPFWSVKNIAKVWSRGVEPRFSYVFLKKELSLKMDVGYDYIRSTNQVALERPMIEKGTQLLYTPEHQAFFKISFNSKKWDFIYRHNYTGASRGVNLSLPSYQVGNVRLQYKMGLDRFNGALFFNANNIWGAKYYVVERRPMPGLNFLGGVKIDFSK